MKILSNSNFLAFIPKQTKPVVYSFLAGAGLELFMNYFHIGEANIYRSILKNMSDLQAQNQFERELITAGYVK